MAVERRELRVSGDLRHLFHRHSRSDQASCERGPKVVKMQVFDLRVSARAFPSVLKLLQRKYQIVIDGQIAPHKPGAVRDLEQRHPQARRQRDDARLLCLRCLRPQGDAEAI